MVHCIIVGEPLQTYTENVLFHKELQTHKTTHAWPINTWFWIRKSFNQNFTSSSIFQTYFLAFEFFISLVHTRLRGWIILGILAFQLLDNKESAWNNFKESDFIHNSDPDPFNLTKISNIWSMKKTRILWMHKMIMRIMIRSNKNSHLSSLRKIKRLLTILKEETKDPKTCTRGGGTHYSKWRSSLRMLWYCQLPIKFVFKKDMY